MREVLKGEGISETLIWSEDQSTSTHEAAVYTAAILRKQDIQRVALVTEAYHMARAEAAFRKEGLIVIPAPCRFHGISLTLYELLPGAEAIALNENALHEWVGLLWYRMHGWI